jgi:RNA polymerase sigma-70 factor (ECF subfamily)
VQDELALLARARTFDLDALAKIHDVYYPSIFRYIAYRIDDPQAAEDLASEVFTRLLAALKDQRAPQTTLQGWLFSVAARLVNDHHRRRYRRAHTTLYDELPDDDDSPADIAEANATRGALREALGELTEEQQTVIALRFGSDLPIRDVAEIMGKTEGAVKQLQVRAIAALTRKLSGEIGP